MREEIWIEVIESFQGDELMVSATMGNRTLRRRLHMAACEDDPTLVKRTADALAETLLREQSEVTD